MPADIRAVRTSITAATTSARELPATVYGNPLVFAAESATACSSNERRWVGSFTRSSSGDGRHHHRTVLSGTVAAIV